mgnify:CR=1 FL=1
MLTLKNWIIKPIGILASLALMITTLNVNTTCMMFVHQPELPDNVKKLRKF